MIPKHIHQIWIGPNPIPPKLIALMDRLREAHPNWKYTLWKNEDVPQMPHHAQVVFDRFYNNGEYAFACDILRYYILMKFGGVYMDCDFALTRGASLDMLPLEKNTLLVNQRVHPSDTSFKYRLQNCFMASAPDATFARRIFDSIGRIRYILTDLKRCPCEKYSCQYITTEYLMHIEHKVAKKTIHLITKDLTKLIPTNEAILDYQYFFGNNAIIAKHLYANSHKKRKQK